MVVVVFNDICAMLGGGQNFGNDTEFPPGFESSVWRVGSQESLKLTSVLPFRSF